MKRRKRTQYAFFLLIILLIGIWTSCEQQPEESTTVSTTSPLPSCSFQYKTSDAQFTYDIYELYAEITGYVGDDPVILLPETVDGYAIMSVGEDAFAGNQIVTDVTFPTPLVNISHRAFSRCTNLANITMRNVRAIGIEAFRGTALTEVTFPESLQNLGKYSFGETLLTEVTLPGSIVRAAGYAFAGCQNLEKVTLGSGFTEITDRMFSGCSSLREVSLCQDLKKIGAYAFASCQSLTTITIPASVSAVGEGCFLACPQELVIHTAAGSAAEQFAIRSGITCKTDS